MYQTYDMLRLSFAESLPRRSGWCDIITGSGLTTRGKQPGGDINCINNLYTRWVERLDPDVYRQPPNAPLTFLEPYF